MLEVRSELAGLSVDLRFDPHVLDAMPRVFVEGAFYCDTVLLDVVKNASGKRRRRSPKPKVEPIRTGLDPLGLIADEHVRRTRPPCTPCNDNDNDNDEEK